MGLFRFVVLSVLVLLPGQLIAAESNIRTISVTGKSETVVGAQYATIKLEIKHVRREMNQSHVELMKSVAKLSNALGRIGLAETTMKQSLVLQGPEYTWVKNSQVLRGYYSQCHIELRVDDMTKMPLVYSELANIKYITIQGTEFKRHDEFSIQKGEYESALKAARIKAEYMAQALQAKVGRVHSIQEVSFDDGYHAAGEVAANVLTRSKAESARSETKVEYGSIKMTAVVAVEFELE